MGTQKIKIKEKEKEKEKNWDQIYYFAPCHL
jgi:hypothetical protein